MFLKRGINYSASRASENGMWDPSATLQDPDIMLVHTLEGPVAQNFRPADVATTYNWAYSPTYNWGNPQKAPSTRDGDRALWPA